MKWVYILGLIIGTPALAGFLKASPRYLVPAAFVLGLLMFVAMPSFWVAPIPWPGWPGPVQGLEVSFVDGISIALIAATPPIRIPLMIKLPFSIIVLAAAISTFAGFQIMPAVFYDWQLFRAVLLFIAVARLCTTVPAASPALLAGLGLGLAYEAVLATQQYLAGAQRPGGNLGHSNFLGFSSYVVVFPALSLLLGTRRNIWPAATIFSGLVIAIVGGSRATTGLFAIGVILTIGLSLRRNRSSRKLAIAGAALAFLIVAAPVMLWAVSHRSEESKTSSDLERSAMKVAAGMIISEHPLGIGANQYVLVANIGGYSARAGVPWNYSSRSAPVHNTYYLVAAEMGLLGLVGLISLLLAFILFGFRQLGRPSRAPNDELVPGLLATVITTSIHLSYEWIFMTFILHYLFAIGAGMLVGLAGKIGAPKRAVVGSPVARPMAADTWRTEAY